MSAPPPAAARELFGPKLPQAEAYAALLVGAGVERGLIGPAEAGRIWERHLINSGLLAELLPARLVGGATELRGAGLASAGADVGRGRWPSGGDSRLAEWLILGRGLDSPG